MYSNDDKKGFSGISSLVSDIRDHELIKLVPKNEPLTKTETKPEEKFGVWILGIIIFIIFVPAIVSNNKPSSNPPTSSQSRTSQQSSPAPAAKTIDVPQAVYTPSFQITNPELEYSKPPVGTGKLLSLPEIRWCIREGIRIEAMRDVIDTNKGIDEFNRIVDDYNRRAGSYRYHQGDKARAEREVGAHRSQIVAEAILEAKQWGRSPRQPSLSVAPSNTPEKPSPQLIREAQQILTDLGYDPGPIDGQYGRRTSNAVKAFQKNIGLPQDGQIDQNLLNKLRNANVINKLE